MAYRLVSSLLSCVLLSSASIALADQHQNADTPRPRIAIVLGGGGAHGVAHLGVLQELERQRVPIDLIVGTGFGGVVGGLYAAGMSVAEIRDFLFETDDEETTYWTSTVYADSSENASDLLKLYRVYVGEAGQLLGSDIVNHGRRPQGNHRVLVVAIDYGNTNIAEVLDNEWLDAQQEINQALIDLATSQGFAEPILQFSNTNILVDRSEIDNPEIRQHVEAVASEKGYEKEDYDILVSLDLDAQNPVPSGVHDGFSNGRDFVYMGYYFATDLPAEVADLRRGRAGFLAQNVYDHHIGHIFGWEHSWTPQEGGFFITQPDLYGWTDVDGDGIREIEDPTPYGRSWEW